jgi:hypothetical protein
MTKKEAMKLMGRISIWQMILIAILIFLATVGVFICVASAGRVSP